MAIAEQKNLPQVPLAPEQPINIDPIAWILFIDGSSAANGSRVGIDFRTPERVVIELVVRLGFKTSNNDAEYEALIVGM